MKRRKFINNIARLSAAPLLLNGLSVHSFATPSMLSLRSCQGVSERVLVLIFLKGGNDGLNTIIPVENYSFYANHRPTLRIKDSGTNSYIPLDTTLPLADQVGLHPALTSFKSLYDDGYANVIQGVGYPMNNQSHFKSRDLWLSGGDGTSEKFDILSGWMGRYIETAFPGQAGMPNNLYPDPLGIQLGDTKPSLGLHNHFQEYIGTNLSGQNPSNLFGLLNGLGTATHQNTIASDYGAELEYIMNVENSTNAYGQRITDIYNAGSNSSATYPMSSLADQLRTVARMIAGGSTTKIYLVHKHGFDTHASQVVSGMSHLGNHATHLADVFDSIKAFHTDLTNLGLADRVLLSTFSEFGRRVVQNGSLGTDHGSLSNMFLIGNGIKAGVIGTNLDLENILPNGLVDPNSMQVDYRSVFKTLLQDWLGADDSIVGDALLGTYAAIPSLISSNFKVDPSCYLPPMEPCPCTYETLVLNDQPIPDGTIVKVSDWVSINGTIAAGTGVDIMAKNHVLLTPGFVAEAESEVTIGIQDCITTNEVQGKIVELNDRKQTAVTPINPEIEDTIASASSIKLPPLFLYPNPAQDHLNILYRLEERQEISIVLYTEDGQLVKTLIDRGTRNQGEWQMQINCSELSSGLYIVELATPKAIEFQKIVIHK